MTDTREATVPDIGDFTDVPVIEVLVKPGDRVEKDQGLVTLESAKATMEVPAPFAGTVREVKVKENDTVSRGSVIALIEAGEGAASPPSPAGRGAGREGSGSAQTPESAGKVEAREAEAATTRAPAPEKDPKRTPAPASPAQTGDVAPPRSPPVPFDADSVAPDKVPYASPAVRAFARELGVDIARVHGSARGGRITKEDVQAFVKSVVAGGALAHAAATGGGGLQLLPWPQVDFSKYGEVEEKPLSRIKKVSGANLARNWAMIPHVTQHESADITDMEAFRKQLGAENKEVKITPLVFLIKAVVAALKQYPQFNASLDASGEKLILKKYFHIGIAVDTPDGLVVPVIRDADRKGLLELAIELGEISKKARDKKLSPNDMSGGCFSISSLGGIGGTAFTPIINAPEVAILGVSRSSMQPVWNGNAFEPRLMLPLSLSYDHRVIDGADAARFAAYLARVLGDLRRLLV
jgi:pyruvate dehydrogenase E2 component (dihydrolipoamide acetyltransferase)